MIDADNGIHNSKRRNSLFQYLFADYQAQKLFPYPAFMDLHIA